MSELFCASTGKVRYPTQRKATKAARAIRRGRRTRDFGGEQRAYECPDCGDWHLTTQRRSRTA